MRYADAPGVQVEVHIHAPPEVVWALVSDIGVPARFSSELQETSWLDTAGAPAVGARFVGRNRHPAVGEWEATCTVTACEAGLTFAWVVGEPDNPSASWRFDIEPSPTGGVLLREEGHVGPGPSGLTRAIEAMPDKEERIVAARLEEHRANMQAVVEGVKALAEAVAVAGG